MLKSNTLPLLISSLSSHEKKYIKQYYAIHIDQNHDLRLFNIIEQYIEELRVKTDTSNPAIKFSDKEIKSKITERRLLRYYAKIKNDLYNGILKCLRQYHTKGDPQLKMLAFLSDIQILIDKDLIDQAYERIQKAKKHARQFHFSNDYLQLLLIERKIGRQAMYPKVVSQLESLSKAAQQTYALIGKHLKILDVYDPFHVKYRNGKLNQQDDIELIEEAERIIDQSQIGEGVPGAARTKIDLEALKSNFFLFKGDQSSILRAYREINRLFQDHSSLIIDSPGRYIRMMTNYLNIALRFGEPNEIIKQGLEQLEALSSFSKVRLKNLAFQYFVNKFTIRLKMYIYQGDYEKVTELVPEIEQELKNFKDSILEPKLIPLYHNIATAFFLVRDFDKVEEWAKKIDRLARLEDKKASNVNIQVFAEFLIIISYYESWLSGIEGRNDSADSNILRLKRKLQKTSIISILKPLIPGMQELLRTIKKACNLPLFAKEKRRVQFVKLYHYLIADKIWQKNGQLLIGWVKEQTR